MPHIPDSGTLFESDFTSVRHNFLLGTAKLVASGDIGAAMIIFIRRNSLSPNLLNLAFVAVFWEQSVFPLGKNTWKHAKVACRVDSRRAAIDGFRARSRVLRPTIRR